MRVMLLTLLILVFAIGAMAQEQPSAVDFSAGLVTNKNILTRNFWEADICHNIDLTLHPGAFTPRLGYTKVMDLPNVDSMLWNGFHAIDYRDGSKQWLVLGAWADDSGFAGIFKSGMNSLNFGNLDALVLVPDVATLAATSASFTVALAFEIGGASLYMAFTFDTTGYYSTAAAMIADTLVSKINNAADKIIRDIWGNPTDTVDFSDFVIASRGEDTLYVGEKKLTHSTTVWLMQSFDSSRVAYDDIPTTAESRFPSTGRVAVKQFRDRVQITSSAGASKLFTDEFVLDYPPRAPGVLSAMTLDKAGTVTGVVRYALRDRLDSTSNYHYVPGVLSAPVRVDSGQVRLWNFPKPSRHAGYVNFAETPDTTFKVDTSRYQIWRTLGDCGMFDDNDSIFLVDTINIASDEWSTAEFTDTMSDVTLRAKSGKLLIPDDLGFPTQPADTVDSIPAFVQYYHPGAPMVLGFAPINDTSTSGGLWRTGTLDTSVVGFGEALGFSWIITAYDTLAGVQSDSGSSTYFYKRQAYGAATGFYFDVRYNADTAGGVTTFSQNRTESATLVMPGAPGGMDNIQWQLWRAPIAPTIADTALTYRYVYQRDITVLHKALYTADSVAIVDFYHFVGSYAPNDTVVDSLRYDSLMARPRWERNAAPELPSATAVAGNRFFYIDRSSVSVSEVVDSITRFDVLQRLLISPDDGDANTSLWASPQGVVHIAKNKSLYMLYRQNGIWQTPELSAHYGVVAPYSVAHSPEGTFFLSWDGIRLLAESGDRARSFAAPVISGGVVSFEGMPITTLREAYGMYYNNKYILTFPSLDTAFVVNVIRQKGQPTKYAISTWSLGMVGGDLSRVGSIGEIVPGDSLYFIKSGDPGIYLYGSSYRDEGDMVQWVWRSGPSNPVDGWLRSAEELSLYVETDDTTDYMFSYQLYNENGAAGHGLPWTSASFHAGDSTRYHRKAIPANTGALFWRVGLWNTVWMTGRNDVPIIRGLWLKQSKTVDYGTQQ